MSYVSLETLGSLIGLSVVVLVDITLLSLLFDCFSSIVTVIIIFVATVVTVALDEHS